MKNKTVILILSVLAVALYTVAVINFCLGNVLGGIDPSLLEQHPRMFERSRQTGSGVSLRANP